MIEIGSDVLVKLKDDFAPATVLEIAKNEKGKSIYRVSHYSDGEGYWIDGSKVFDTEQKSNSYSVVKHGSTVVN